MKVLFYYREFEALGVEYVIAALKKAGHKVDLIFDPSLGDNPYIKLPKLEAFDVREKMFEKARKFAPDLLAFSSVTYIHPDVRAVAGRLKKELGVPTIIGGVHPTIAPDKVIREEEFDIVCVGEGEGAAVDVANSLESGDLRTDIPNIWLKHDGKVFSNPVRNLIENLDELPYPDKDVFYKYGAFADRVYVMAGRGCPYQCTYCFNHQFRGLYEGKGKYVRMRSADNVIEELKLYVKKYRPKSFAFEDDTFTLLPQWFNEFCKKYEDEIGLPFRALVRANTIKPETAQTLKKAGCKWVHMGLESGDDYIRNTVLKRNVNTQTMIDAREMFKHVGIKVKFYNIFEFPEETEEAMWNTVKLNELTKPDAAGAFLFVPYPGTELAEHAVKTGYLSLEAYERMKRGGGSIHFGSELSHPYANLAQNLKVLMPIYIRSPRPLKEVLKKLMTNKRQSPALLKALYLASIPFLSGGDVIPKTKEAFSMLKKTLQYDKIPVNGD